MIKTLIAPVQAWLLSQGRCVACGRELNKQKVGKKRNNEIMTTCECGRVFMKDQNSGKFRRALMSELV